MEPYGAGQIQIVDYDPTWPEMFERECESIRRALGSLIVRIEHMGSTAVPGLPAKPIIDILIGVSKLEEVRSICIRELLSLGYVHITTYESWLPNELFFRKGIPGPWTHHVHIMEPSRPGNRWDEFLLFRDYLRAHPEAARAYAEMKRAAASAAVDDIEAYRNAKSRFVEAAKAEARRAGLVPKDLAQGRISGA
jgi:GrpB-like predicted nucleotidyltransferase (UPF0157 family)